MAIELIDKIGPYNNAFRGMVGADQLIGTAGSFGVNIVGTALGYKGYKVIPSSRIAQNCLTIRNSTCNLRNLVTKQSKLISILRSNTLFYSCCRAIDQWT